MVYFYRLVDHERVYVYRLLCKHSLFILVLALVDLLPLLTILAKWGHFV